MKEHRVKVETNDGETILLIVDSWESLKEKIKSKMFDKKVEYFTREDDFAIITDEQTFSSIAAEANGKEIHLTVFTKEETRILRQQTQITKSIKKSQETDFAFLVDCTGSMDKSIAKIKLNIKAILEDLKEKILPHFEYRLAFVGYRDHSDGDRRIIKYDFGITSQTENFENFLENIEASGGGDECEDVFGGLEAIGQLSWMKPTRIMLHLCDAPCHGKQYYDYNALDYFPNGDPNELKIDQLLKKISSEKKIKYFFIEITHKETDRKGKTKKMIDEFNKVLVSLGEKKIIHNESYADFITNLIYSSVIHSVIDSKTSFVMDAKANNAPGRTRKDIFVDTNQIEWSKDKMQEHNAVLYTASFNGRIEDIPNQRIEFTESKCNIWIAPKPFDSGTQRFAYAALKDEQKYVVKTCVFQGDQYNTKDFYTNLIENQVLSAFLMEKYFATFKQFEKHASFIQVDIIKLDDGSFWSIEEYFDAKFIKWSNNIGIVDENNYSLTLDTFSHWTYDITKGYLLVADIQGFKLVNSNNQIDYILTDPAIICTKSADRFSDTNIGLRGINDYFKNHKCNHHCRVLELKKQGLQPDGVRDFGGTKIPTVKNHHQKDK